MSRHLVETASDFQKMKAKGTNAAPSLIVSITINLDQDNTKREQKLHSQRKHPLNHSGPLTVGLGVSKA